MPMHDDALSDMVTEMFARLEAEEPGTDYWPFLGVQVSVQYADRRRWGGPECWITYVIGNPEVLNALSASDRFPPHLCERPSEHLLVIWH